MTSPLADRFRNFAHSLFMGDDPPSPWRRRRLRFGRLIYLTSREIHKDLCFERAASLSFSTVLSLIPLAILFFFLFDAEGRFQALVVKGEEFVVDTLVPASSRSDRGAVSDPDAASTTGAGSAEDQTQSRDATRAQVRENLKSFVQSLKASVESSSLQGRVKIIAIVALLLAVGSLYHSAERTFCVIWGVSPRRGILSKLGTYWLMFTLPPLLLLLALYLRESIQDQTLTTLIGVSTAFFAFLLLFLYLPNTRVRSDAAAFGAFAAAFGWELGVLAFRGYIERAVVTSVYGALGVIPFFLLFVYFAWVLTLIGSEISYSVQNYQALIREVREGLAPLRRSLAIPALLVMERIYRGFQGSAARVSAGEIANDLSLPVSAVEEIVQCAIERQILATGANGIPTPAMAPEQLHLLDVVRLFSGGMGFDIAAANATKSGTPLAQYLTQVGQGIDADLATRTFKDYLA